MTLLTGQIQLFYGTDGRVLWRMLSGNHWEVARSGVRCEDLAAAQASLHDLQGRVGELAHRMRRAGSEGWTWELFDTDEHRVIVGRRYDRLIRCEQSLLAFRTQFPTAAVAGTVIAPDSRRRRQPVYSAAP
jgi:hypothetical protein